MAMSNFILVSHPYMTPDAEEEPPRPARQEILWEELAREDHVVDVLFVCRRIMVLA